MTRRTGLFLTLTLAVLPALGGCAGSPARVNPEWPGYLWGGRSEEPKADPAQVQQQLASLTAQLSAELRARPVQRIAVLSFENTSGQNPESLGAYLTEKITTLLYADRVGTVVERTFLPKVLDEIQRGYSGPFDPLALKEIGRLLNADTLVLGSYTRLTNGMTEVMARAVFVETGEIMGASSATISGGIVPNVPLVVRGPLMAQGDVPPAASPESGWRPTEGEGPGTFNVVPSPAPGLDYVTPQFAPVAAYSAYPTPQVVIPSYSYAPYSYGYAALVRPPYPTYFRYRPLSSRPSHHHSGRR